MLQLLLVLCLRAPVPGPVVSPYAPQGAYAGHHGVDFAATAATSVRAAGPGSVSFAGSVAGMLTVTVDHGNGLRSTVSYLEEVLVLAGDRVATGAILGRGGHAHDRGGLHFSVRVDGIYVDPMEHLLCGRGGSEKLYLLPPPSPPYPRRRDQRPPGGNLRPPAHRPPAGR